MQDFIKFRKMITPPYHPDPVLGGRGRYGHRRAGDDGQQLRTLGGGAATFLGGLIFLVVGPVMVRIYCELLILFFRMNETLTEIKDLLASK